MIDQPRIIAMTQRLMDLVGQLVAALETIEAEPLREDAAAEARRLAQVLSEMQRDLAEQDALGYRRIAAYWGMRFGSIHRIVEGSYAVTGSLADADSLRDRIQRAAFELGDVTSGRPVSREPTSAELEQQRRCVQELGELLLREADILDLLAREDLARRKREDQSTLAADTAVSLPAEFAVSARIWAQRLRRRINLAKIGWEGNMTISNHPDRFRYKPALEEVEAKISVTAAALDEAIP